MVTRIGLLLASDCFAECFFENSRAFQNRLFGYNQWRRDLYGSAAEPNRREHQYSLLEAEPRHVPRQIRIGCRGTGYHARKSCHQAPALYDSDLRKAALKLAQTPVQDIAGLAGVRCQLFVYDQI